MATNDESALTVTREQIRTTSRIVVVGELEISTCHDLRAELDAALAVSERIELDLAGVDFMDSTGISCLLQLRAHAQDRGHTMAIVATSRRVKTIIEVTGLASVLLA